MSSRIRKGDRVIVIRVDDKGKQGKVTRVIHERDMVVVCALTDVDVAGAELSQP